jgi:hypothetical protein
MSMLGYDLQEAAVKEKGLFEPAEILMNINQQIIEKLNRSNTHGASDGMDVTLCRLNLKTRHLTFAGTGNDLLIISGGRAFSRSC